MMLRVFTQSIKRGNARCFSRSASHSSEKLYGYLWGAEKSGVLPVPGSSGKEMLRPEPVLDGEPLLDVAFGNEHTAIVHDDGGVWMYGVGKNGELGLSGISQTWVPTQIEELSDIVKVACGKNHTAALSANGDVYTWGWGGGVLNIGGLGHGDKELVPTPKKVANVSNIVDIACGEFTTFALAESGQLYAWGRGDFGALGHGSSSGYPTPAIIDSLDGTIVNKISCTSSFAGAVTDNGILLMWGRNDAGQLAQPEGLLEFNNMEAVPCIIELFLDEGLQVRDFSCGERHTVAVTDDNHLYEWGNNQWMQPRLVGGDDGFMLENEIVSCGAGNKFSAAVDVNGFLFTWGDGRSCCLGHGNKDSEHNPTLVEGFGSGPDAEFGEVQRVICAHKRIAALVTR